MAWYWQVVLWLIPAAAFLYVAYVLFFKADNGMLDRRF